MRRLVVALALTFATGGCAKMPGPRGEVEVTQSANAAEVHDILEHYREVRNTALSLLNPNPLSVVEGGAMLAIDTGLFEVAQRLSRTQNEAGRQLQVRKIETPTFTKYPLWFMVWAYDPAARVDVAQIFERTTPVDPWLLVAGPHMLPTVQLPGLRHDGDGNAVAVQATNGKGMEMSPEQAATAYSRALSSATGKNPPVAPDGFISQMRTAFEQVNALDGVTMTQSWAPEKVRHALRTEDGGALVWVTLLRLDSYTVDPGITVKWPEGSPQQAFLKTGISGTGKLRHYYQVLLSLPGGGGEPQTVGWYGGVISGETEAPLAPRPVPDLGGSSEPFPGVTLAPPGLVPTPDLGDDSAQNDDEGTDANKKNR